MSNALLWQWFLVLVSSLILFLLAPRVHRAEEFFKAANNRTGPPNVFLLTSSLVISWIFAKSITNAADLGLAYGLVGGVAYGGYYLSFLVAGVVLYQLRTRGKFESIHHFLGQKYGKGAILTFSLLIAFRLFNEVWSNTLVIGSYFGQAGTSSYYSAILVFTGLTLAYVIKGGLRSSLMTDLIQMVVFGLLLVVILGWLIPDMGGFHPVITSGSWNMSSGLALLWVAIIQSLSYPFHDPVMTDRGFISSPMVMKRSFFWAGGLGFLFITLFSVVGIYAQQTGLTKPAAVSVSQALGLVMMLVVNFIMITSAASTLDSTFSSFSKLMVLDLRVTQATKISTGRWMMVLLAVIGTLPVFLNPTVLSATTISGTMVIGLAPVFLLWRWPVPRWAFFGAIGIGVALGVAYAAKAIPKSWMLGKGPYMDLLSVNLWGTLAVFALFGVARMANPKPHAYHD